MQTRTAARVRSAIMGRLFRLHRFDGWLIVMTWRGLPIAGPVRMRREVSA